MPDHIRLGPITVCLTKTWDEKLYPQLCDVIAHQIVEISILRAKLAYYKTADVGELIVEEFQRWANG